MSQASVGTCKACGVAIRFIRPGEKDMPIDDQPILCLVRGERARDAFFMGYAAADYSKVFGWRVADATPHNAETMVDGQGRQLAWVHRPHWSTCTEPERFRRPKSEGREPGTGERESGKKTTGETPVPHQFKSKGADAPADAGQLTLF